MGIKDGCCGLCAWFSVIGSAFFLILSIMLYRKNPAVIEHKFHLSLDDKDGIAHSHFQMIVMTIVMIGASAVCFVSSFSYAKRERDQEIADKERAHLSYNHIFGDDQVIHGSDVHVEMQQYGVN